MIMAEHPSSLRKCAPLAEAPPKLSRGPTGLNEMPAAAAGASRSSRPIIFSLKPRAAAPLPSNGASVVAVAAAAASTQVPRFISSASVTRAATSAVVSAVSSLCSADSLLSSIAESVTAAAAASSSTLSDRYLSWIAEMEAGAHALKQQHAAQQRRAKLESDLAAAYQRLGAQSQLSAAQLETSTRNGNFLLGQLVAAQHREFAAWRSQDTFRQNDAESLKAANRRISQLEQDLTESNRRLTTQLEQHEIQLQAARRDTETARRGSEASKRDSDAVLVKDVSVLRQRIEQQRMEARTSEEKWRAASAQQRKELQTQLAAALERCTSLAQQATDLQQSLSVERSTAESATRRIGELQQRIAYLEHQHTIASARATQLQQSLSAEQLSVRSAEQRNTDLQLRVSELEQSLTAARDGTQQRLVQVKTERFDALQDALVAKQQKRKADGELHAEADKRQRAEKAAAASASSLAIAAAEVESLRATNEQLESDKPVCCACLEFAPAILFAVPSCSHAVLCPACSDDLVRRGNLACPKCRVTVPARKRLAMRL